MVGAIGFEPMTSTALKLQGSLQSDSYGECSEAGPKAGPINGPTSNRVGTQFSFDSLLHFGGGSLANRCGLSSSARWQLDPIHLFNCPKLVK